MPQISIVIPSKNGSHHLNDCLPSVIKATKKSNCDIEIIVIDDNSTDNTLDTLPQKFPEVTFVKNPKQGICSARNFGVKNSSGTWLFFLDNDVLLEEDFFAKAVKYLKDDIFCVACCGYLAADPTKQLDGIKLLYWKRGFMRFTGNILNQNLDINKQDYPSFGVQGAYFFCKKDKFLQLNGFDENFDPCTVEESDLAYRGLKRGWKIIYAPDTHPLHKCGGTIQSKVNKRTQFLSRRNRLIFVWKNITSKRLLFSNLIWCILRPEFKVLKEVWKMRETIKAKRLIETQNAKVSDFELLKQSNNLLTVTQK